MSFFNLLKQKKNLGGIDDDIDGIVDDNSIENEVVNSEIVGGDGSLQTKSKVNQTVTPNIPKIKLFPTLSERYQKQLNITNTLRANDNSTNSMGQKATVDGQPVGQNATPMEDGKGLSGGGTVQNIAQQVLNTEQPKATVNDLINSKVRPVGINPNSQTALDQLFGGNPVQSQLMKAVQQSGATGEGSRQRVVGGQTDPNALPTEPNYDEEPTGEETMIDPKTGKEKKVYGSGKVRNWLVGMLDNIGKLDMSKIPADQRTGAFLGAMLGGSFEGLGTKDYAGKVALNRDKAKVRGVNADKRKAYTDRIEAQKKRIEADNLKLAPELKRMTDDTNRYKAELADSTKREIAQATGDLKRDLAGKSMELQLQKVAQTDRRLDLAENGITSVKTEQRSDGKYYLIGVNKQGKTIDIAKSDGQSVEVADPNGWARQKAEIEAEGEREASTVQPMTTDQIRGKALDSAKAQAQGLGLNWDELTPKRKMQMQKDAEESIRKDETERLKTERSKAKVRGTQKVLNRGKAVKRGSTVTNRIKDSASKINTDLKTQFNNRQK